MKTKHTVLILAFFMCFATVFTGCKNVPPEQPILPPPLPPPQPTAPSNARFIPITWDIVNDIENHGLNLRDLPLYPSKPFSITIIERNNAPRTMEITRGVLRINREQSALPRRINFSTSNAGTLRNNEESSGIFIVDFRVEGNNIPLRFKKNSHGLFDLISAEVETRPYDILSDDGVPQLCIFAELNEHLEVRAFFPDDSRRRTAAEQPVYRDSGRSHETFNSIGSHPSRNIAGQPCLNRNGAIAYVIRQNPSVNRAALSSLIDTYIEEAQIERVNHDIAVAQMLYMTDFLRNHMATRNYAGFIIDGSRLNGVRWDGSFPDMRTGVKAHIQHLKGYASHVRPNPCVDPRYHVLVDMGYLGQMKTFDQVFRAWSPNNPDYGNRINRILNGLYQSSGN